MNKKESGAQGRKRRAVEFQSIAKQKGAILRYFKPAQNIDPSTSTGFILFKLLYSIIFKLTYIIFVL